MVFTIALSLYYRAIAGATRVVFGRAAISKDLGREMTSRNHSLDEFFHKVDLDLKFKPPKKQKDDSDYESNDEEDDLDDDGPTVELDEDGCIDIKRAGVFTTDLDEFVSYLMVHRVLDPSTTLVKIGLDDGQVVMGFIITTKVPCINGY